MPRFPQPKRKQTTTAATTHKARPRDDLANRRVFQRRHERGLCLRARLGNAHVRRHRCPQGVDERRGARRGGLPSALQQRGGDKGTGPRRAGGRVAWVIGNALRHERGLRGGEKSARAFLLKCSERVCVCGTGEVAHATHYNQHRSVAALHRQLAAQGVHGQLIQRGVTPVSGQARAIVGGRRRAR
jgi:hypothetical protein